MSYEPTLVILKKDLKKQEDLLENGDWQYKDKNDEKIGEEGKTVMEYLQDVNRRKTIIIGKVELVLCSPCFSSFNKAVREKLQELNIEFAEDN